MIQRSPGPIASSAGMHTPITSTSEYVSRTRSLSRCPPSSVRGRCSPGVSTRISWASGRLTIPRIVWRVVCGRLEVIAIFSPPTSALVSVDLPVLGAPDETDETGAEFRSGAGLRHRRHRVAAAAARRHR